MPQDANYDESRVPAYSVPDPLRSEAGEPIADPDAWAQRRRPELLAIFQDQFYGRMPDPPASLDIAVVEHGSYLDGRADRFQIRLGLRPGETEPSIDLLLYVPTDCMMPAPVFLGLNFPGNHATQDDPAILLPRSWVHESYEAPENRATEAGRGLQARRWPLTRLIDAGYAVATAYYGDIDPDFDDGFRNGVHAHFGPAPEQRDASSWGSLGAWAWGLSRCLDALQDFAMVVDPERCIVHGHSRLGKAALWAAATDPRFAACVSNDSGCGGAALHRRCFGERLAVLSEVRPQWHCAAAANWDGREADMPVDAHELLALIAPRPLYVASASEDPWADPKGELASLHHAAPVWRLHGHADAVIPAELPAPGGAWTGGPLAYHLRQGPHDIIDWDWQRFIAWADAHVR